MLASGDWITPRLNDLAYLEKPPLQYWLTALSLKAFGMNEWAARLAPLLAGIANIWLVWLLGRRLGGASAGILAALLLGSSVMHFLLGQTLTLDMLFTALMTGMLCCFCLSQLPQSSGHWLTASWVLLGLAVMTKGIVALVIAGGVLGLYIVWQRDWPLIGRMRLPTGLVILLAITVPWFFAVARSNPDFWQFFFVREHFQRFLTDVADRVEPWWYFGAVLAAGCLPWVTEMARSLLFGWRATQAPGRFDPQRLLWLWCVFIVIFFSLSKSKLAPYMLPVVPALALLTALRNPNGRIRGQWLGIAMLLLGSAGLLVASFRPDWVSTDPYVAEVAGRARWGIIAILVLALVAAAGVARARRGPEHWQGVAWLAAGWFGSLALLMFTLGHEDQLRSGRALVPVLATVPPGTPMFSVQTYDQTLPFYLNRTMTMVNYRGELAYGIDRAPQLAIASMAQFQQRWQELPAAVAIMPLNTYENLRAQNLPMRVLGQDRRRVAVSRP